MGLTKQYLRFVPSGQCNIIASTSCNICFVVLNGQEGRFVAVGAAEDVIIWDLRLSQKAQVFSRDPKFLATYIASNQHYLAVGYSDGTINTFDLRTGESLQVFPGHRSPISCLAFDPRNLRLASGSKDTEVILWDLVAESGIQRLSGHKGVVTQLQFMTSRNILVTASKDTFIKFWDLDTNFCFKTLAGHITEVWSLSILFNDLYIVAGSSDSELRVWTVQDVTDDDIDQIEEKLNNLLVGEDTTDVACPIRCEKAGSILCKRRGRVVSMTADSSRSILACHGDEKGVELFYFCSNEATEARFQKRIKKLMKKSHSSEDFDPSNEKSPGLRDRVMRLAAITTEQKVKSVDIVLGKGEEVRVAVLLNNNSVELHSLVISNTKESQMMRKLQTHGHHSEVRSVSFSSDNLAFVSGCGSEVKVWNRGSLTCLRTIKTGYVLSLCFVPGDRHVLAGLKDGRLLIIDISSADVIEEIAAHSNELWSVSLLPDLTGCITGGADKTVKVWQFDLIPAHPASDEDTQDSKSSVKVLSLLHLRTLKVEETVLAVRTSPDCKLLAVGLMDSTVKIFFLDTFKFFLKLYGHKLPVSCMDICYDSTLIVTGSGDRNIKIWGLDFGDCHKSLFAHEDTVTSIIFIPKTHQFFSAGKDGFIKQWDADNFERILTLQGHHGEAWNLAISPNGQYLVSCGQDRVIRLHEVTEEPLVLEEERETEREQEEEATLASGKDTVVAGGATLNLPSKKTVAAEKAAELILECLEESEKYRLACDENKMEGKKPPPLPPIMQAFRVTTVDAYLLEMLERTRASELEECLLVLPFSSICQLLELLVPLLKTPHHRTELVIRTLIFLVKVHHGPITSSLSLLPTLKNLFKLAVDRLKELKDVTGCNLYGLMFFLRKIEQDEGIKVFSEAIKDKKERDKRKRKRERAIMV